uniref:glycosyltransferase n=1 Tax=Alloprevotella sp. TaxID=1872471 RepID=UPI003FEE6DDB
MKKKIFPILVLYKCSLLSSRTYCSLLKDAKGVEHFLIYDNSPSEFKQILSQNPEEALYIRDTNNSGLSVAYNKGAEIAKNLGYSHVLLLDQDTLFPKEAWDIYNSSLNFIGLIAPLMVTNKGVAFSPASISGWRSKAVKVEPGIYTLSEYSVVNSGMCVPIDLFNRAGGYDYKVYLDYSDYQFQKRLRRVNSSLLIMPFTAQQDFSADCKDYKKLLARYEIYLDCATNFTVEGIKEYIDLLFAVFKHALMLSLRTQKIIFIRKFITQFLLKKSK